MFTSSVLFNTIILLGAIQGFIISTLLFIAKKNRTPNRLLSVLLFLFALASFNIYGFNQHWFQSDFLSFITNIIPMVIVMPMGPLIWFYIRSSLDPSFKLSKRHRIHFYPVLFDLIPSIATLIFIVGSYTGLLENNQRPWNNFIDTYNIYCDIPRWISVTAYLLLSVRYLQALKDNSPGNKKQFNWLQQFTRVFLVFQVIWLLYLIPYVIPRYSGIILSNLGWYPIYIPLAIMIYWMGIKGYLSQQQATGEKMASSSNPLDNATIQHSVLLLKKAMEADQLYLDPNINISGLSQQTGIAQKILSIVLNQHLHKSFPEFINEYRVAAFKEKLGQAEMAHLTIVGIAFECGFTSQASFQRIFKDATGLSPSAYRKTITPVSG